MNYPLKYPNSFYINYPNLTLYTNQAFNISIGYINNLSELNLYNHTQTIIRAYDKDTYITTLSGSIYSYQITAVTSGSHGVFIKIPSLNISYSYYFIVYDPLVTINQQNAFTILTNELPSSYNNNIDNDIINYLDNYASSNVINDYYNVLYDLYNQQYPNYVPNSSGTYNTNWEYAFLGIKNILLTSQNPQNLLQLLYQIPYLTNCTKFDILLFIARYVSYYLNVPHIITENNGTINIYVNSLPSIQWVLGDDTLSVLGSTTILSSTSSSPCEYLLLQLILRLYPVQFNFSLHWIQVADFSSQFTFNGYTYNGDLNILNASFGLQYIGDNFFPFNLYGWTKT